MFTLPVYPVVQILMFSFCLLFYILRKMSFLEKLLRNFEYLKSQKNYETFSTEARPKFLIKKYVFPYEMCPIISNLQPSLQAVNDLTCDRSYYQVILAGMLTEVQGDIQCKVLVALPTIKYLELDLA